MSPAEASIMQAHAGHWTERMREGAAIVFGPVADPKGDRGGLGLVRVTDGDEMRSFDAGNLALRSRKGFRYEVLPMPIGAGTPEAGMR